MATPNLMRLAKRLKVSMAVVIGLGMAGAFTEFSTRAMFLLPTKPVAAFVSVGEPAAVSYAAGYLVERPGANPGNRRRRAQRLIPSIAPADALPENAPGVAAFASVNDVAPTSPGIGLVRPEAGPLASLRTIPTENRPGTFAGIGGQPGTSNPETPPPAVPEPPAWMLALAGLALLGAFHQGKKYLAEKQDTALA